MNPTATVAVRMLDALGVTTKEQAREALIIWCKPSPRLSVLDVRQILAEFPAASTAEGGDYERDDINVEHPGPVPPGVQGYGISGRTDGGDQS